jgi:subtilisin family serine protease
VDIPGVTRQQPFVDGPGVSVVSSYAGSDTQCANFPAAFCSGKLRKCCLLTSCAWSGRYASASGTSMSCPHVSGYIAVLLAEAPDLTIEQVEALITVRPPPCYGFLRC